MSLLASIGAAKGALSFVGGFFKDHKGGLSILLIVVMGCALAVSVRSCQKNKENLNKYKSEAASNIRAAHDSHQKEKLRILEKADKEVALKDSTVQVFMDSLNLKERQIKKLERLKFGKTTTKYVTQYDTLYEFIELNPSIPNRFKIKHDNCITIFGDFTKDGLKTTVKRDIEVFDISYYERRRLFGWKWTPRIGKKQFYQTLITNCGDTVSSNREITFE